MASARITVGATVRAPRCGPNRTDRHVFSPLSPVNYFGRAIVTAISSDEAGGDAASLLWVDQAPYTIDLAEGDSGVSTDQPKGGGGASR